MFFSAGWSSQTRLMAVVICVALQSILQTMILPLVVVHHQQQVKHPMHDFIRKASSPPDDAQLKKQPQPPSNCQDVPPINFTDFLQHQSEADIYMSHPPWAVFYNIYTRPESEQQEGAKVSVRQALKIVEEQLAQLAVSYAARKYASADMKLPIYFNTIGSPLAKRYTNKFCNKHRDYMTCTHMQHYDSAFEEVTLQRVHDYCHAFPLNRVVYIHSKGTYNIRGRIRKGGKNQYWRRHMTHAVSHQDCLEPPDTSCNLCGLVFTPLPWLHFSGNFFTADCGYIRKLLPLTQYRHKLRDLASITRQQASDSHLTFQLFPPSDAYLGLDRYASEHWPGSHPDLVPCDLSLKRSINFWKRDITSVDSINTLNESLSVADVATAMNASGSASSDTSSSSESLIVGNMEEYLNFSLAPRPLVDPQPMKNVAKDKRIREYFLLAGNLLKWNYLYGGSALPSEQSWIWSFFPDGEEWKSYSNDETSKLNWAEMQ